MTTTLLTRKTAPETNIRFDLSAVVPTACTANLGETRIPIIDSCDHTTVDALFTIAKANSIDDSDAKLVIEGDLSDCDRIAGDQTQGSLEIRGNAGNWLADGMRGGEVSVMGNVLNFAGSGLINGKANVIGNAGDYVAGVDNRRRRGMRGGVLCIEGNSGDWLASRMRGGQVITNGNTGLGSATDMIAGTVVFFKKPKIPIGLGARRGTLVMAYEGQFESPGFTSPESIELSFLPMLTHWLNAHAKRELTISKRGVKRSIGDRTNRGQSEIIFLNPIG